MYLRAVVGSAVHASRRFHLLSLAFLLLAALTLASSAVADRIVLLVEDSERMATTDAERLIPDALSRFVGRLPPATEVAIVAFNRRAHLIVPPAQAHTLASANFEGLTYDGAASDPSVAVERALYEFRDQRADRLGQDVIVLIIDGGIELDAATANQRAEGWLQGDLRDELVARGVTVWGVALTEAADFRMLSRLTDATGGDYYRALTNADAETALGRIASAMGYPAPNVGGQPAPRPLVSQSGRAASAAAPETGEDKDLRWWLAFGFFAIGIALLSWVMVSMLRERRIQAAAAKPAQEYFPDCYLVDLHGVTDRPTHRLGKKYNMITRLQNPPEDGINYLQVFRRQIGRRHALIEYRDFSFWVIDQNSLNGSFINGERLIAETRLKHGDRLRFHIYEFEFCVSDLALSNETLVEQERANAR